MAASTGWRNRPNFHPPGTVFDGRRRGPDFRTCPTKHPVNVSPTEHPKALTPNNWKPLRACLEMSWVISAGYASVRLRNRTEIMMPWTEITRKRYERNPMGCSSDVTDGQWTVVSRLLPGCNRLGRPHKSALRDIWNAIRYIAASGCARSLLPKDFTPVSTVRCYFHRWRDNGLLHEVNRAWRPWYATHRAEAIQGVSSTV